MKLLVTQLTGALQRLEQTMQEEIEFTARILAQSSINDGILWVWSTPELQGVVVDMLQGQNAFKNARQLTSIDDVQSIDRVLLITTSATDEQFLAQVSAFQHFSGVAVISSEKLSDDIFVDASIVTGRGKGLIPLEDGSRIGYVHAILTQFALLTLHTTMNDMLEDFLAVDEDVDVEQAD